MCESGVTDLCWLLCELVHLQEQKLCTNQIMMYTTQYLLTLKYSGTGSSYTNWYNKKTGNSGIIHITKSHMVDLSSVKIMTHN